MKRLNLYHLLIIVALSFMMIGCKSDEPDNKPTTKGSIFGVITDYATGDCVANANVQLRPGGETTLTGYDGRYEFLNIPDGKYSIVVTKAEYSELIDDFVIEVSNGKTIRRDVQIKKLPTSIRITDLNLNDLSELDYGSDASVQTKSFNIFNNGTIAVNCKLVYSCKWISSVSALPDRIEPGQTVPVVVKLDRGLLSPGLNTTNLTVTTNNGSAELVVKAFSADGNPPVVSISQISEIKITPYSAFCEGYMQNDRGGDILDCGFCFSTSSNPTLDDSVVRLGSYRGRFTHTLTGLQSATTYHVRAFATSNMGTGYSSEVTFTTDSGLPECYPTIITKIGTTTACADSEAYDKGYGYIRETGFCWNTAHNPTIDNYSKKSRDSGGLIYAYLSSLKPNTTYWVRSYAKSAYGIAYGEEVSFTTLSSSGIYRGNK